jgi:hypothetical protein
MATLDGCTVERVGAAEAKAIILRYEWLGTMPVIVGAAYGLRTPSGELAGAVVFGDAPGTASDDLCGSEWRGRAMALQRGACVHWAHPHAASFLISRACRQAYEDFGWVVFYAYSDRLAGEIGVVYQACNWRYLGRSRRRSRTRERQGRDQPLAVLQQGRGALVFIASVESPRLRRQERAGEPELDLREATRQGPLRPFRRHAARTERGAGGVAVSDARLSKTTHKQRSRARLPAVSRDEAAISGEIVKLRQSATPSDDFDIEIGRLDGLAGGLNVASARSRLRLLGFVEAACLDAASDPLTEDKGGALLRPRSRVWQPKAIFWQLKAGPPSRCHDLGELRPSQNQLGRIGRFLAICEGKVETLEVHD